MEISLLEIRHEVKANMAWAFSFLCSFSLVKIMASGFCFTLVTYTQTILFQINKILWQKEGILVNQLILDKLQKSS